MADAIVLLAGGASSRFPGKLEQLVGGEPMLVRVYRRMRESGLPVYVAAKGTFPTAIDALLDCTIVVDRRPGSGPLGGFYSACGEIRANRVYAVAADQPSIDRSVLDRLAERWEPGDEAVVPEHGGHIEPLAALYERSAVLRESFTLLRHGNGAMHAFIERTRARFVPMPPDCFRNVNEAKDLWPSSAPAPSGAGGLG
jgi:molybdopterin-guanine dinucleotide biosynthesis protein A